MSSNSVRTARLWSAPLLVALALGGAFAQTTAQTQPLTVAVGSGPEGLTVAFDGTTLSVWVANQFSNSVTKLRASDGSVLGTFPVGNRPVSVIAAGPLSTPSIWVANNRSDTVRRLRASDGALLGTYPAGPRPQGLAFDGQNVWGSNERSRSVTKLRATDGGKLGTLAVGT